jgi:hypothetical protein
MARATFKGDDAARSLVARAIAARTGHEVDPTTVLLEDDVYVESWRGRPVGLLLQRRWTAVMVDLEERELLAMVSP